MVVRSLILDDKVNVFIFHQAVFYDEFYLLLQVFFLNGKKNQTKSESFQGFKCHHAMYGGLLILDNTCMMY